MRVVILYWLLFATLLPTVSPLGIIAQYQLNKEYIARVLCENRTRPALHCNGQCYLAKRLKAQQDKQDQQTTERVVRMSLMPLFCQATYSIRFAEPTVLSPSPQFAYLISHYPSPLTTLLRPPRR